MAICSKCGAQLFETSKFCPECGTPVLEVSADTNKTGDIYSASENADDENSMAVFQGIDPSEISPDETAEILEAAAEKALEDIPEIVKIARKGSSSKGRFFRYGRICCRFLRI